MTDRLDKKQALAHWARLPKRAALEPRAIPYKQGGSTYGLDGVRIEGSREFIDAVLGRLSDLLAFENCNTRLALNYQKVQPRDGKECLGDWVCYIKVHERGQEAKAVNAWVSGVAGRQIIASAS